MLTAAPRLRVSLLALTSLAFSFGAGCATQLPPLALPERPAGTAGIVIVSHGIEGRSHGWPVAVETAIRDASVRPQMWSYYRVEWHEQSLNRLSAPRAGYEIGRRLGALVREQGYEVVHIIGHSAGAHVAQGVADALARSGAIEPDGAEPARSPVVFATFLDPFVARSAVRLFWGVRRFGRNTHFAESYVTREDRIPFTNSLLRRAHNFDLTPILPDRPDPPDDYAHMWPITYYTASGTDAAAGRGLAPAVLLTHPADAERTARALRDRYPSGCVTVP